MKLSLNPIAKLATRETDENRIAQYSIEHFDEDGSLRSAFQEPVRLRTPEFYATCLFFTGNQSHRSKALNRKIIDLVIWNYGELVW